MTCAEAEGGHTVVHLSVNFVILEYDICCNYKRNELDRTEQDNAIRVLEMRFVLHSKSSDLNEMTCNLAHSGLNSQHSA